MFFSHHVEFLVCMRVAYLSLVAYIMSCKNQQRAPFDSIYVKASFSVHFMTFVNFHNKSHNMKALVILSHYTGGGGGGKNGFPQCLHF